MVLAQGRVWVDEMSVRLGLREFGAVVEEGERASTASNEERGVGREATGRGNCTAFTLERVSVDVMVASLSDSTGFDWARVLPRDTGAVLTLVEFDFWLAWLVVLRR